ncbi:MAG: hypothetical protein R2813_07450 [Flavobacteriales bacterium]
MRIILILFLLIPFVAWSDDKEMTLRAKMQQLYELRMVTINAPNDEKRIAADKEFTKFLKDALGDQNSYNVNFDTIPQLGDLRSGDDYFRMINWNVPLDNQTQQYRCFIQYLNKKTKEYEVIELKKGYSSIEGETRKIFNERNWYGALYYDIIPSKTRRSGRKRTYMLLGWDGHDEYSSIKFVDVLVMTKNRLSFGADIFDMEDKGAKRFIIEYKSDAQVSLKYDERKTMIVFNQLVPMQPDLEGQYEFYVPITEFDALQWKKRKWTYVHDVYLKGRGNGKIYNDPPSAQNLK